MMYVDNCVLVANEIGKIVIKTNNDGQASITNTLFLVEKKSNLSSLS